MIEDCPILSINIKIWLFLSFIRNHHKYIKRYATIIIYICFNVTQWMYLFKSRRQIDVLILNAYLCVLNLNCWVRILFSEILF